MVTAARAAGGCHGVAAPATVSGSIVAGPAALRAVKTSPSAQSVIGANRRSVGQSATQTVIARSPLVP